MQLDVTKLNIIWSCNIMNNNDWGHIFSNLNNRLWIVIVIANSQIPHWGIIMQGMVIRSVFTLWRARECP